MGAPGGISKLLDMLFSWTRPMLARLLPDPDVPKPMLPGTSPVASQQAVVENRCLRQCDIPCGVQQGGGCALERLPLHALLLACAHAR